MRPRERHSTVEMGGQLFHIAGHAKDYSMGVTNGRRVEKWLDITGETKRESGDILFNYISPQSLIVSDDWYHLCA